MTNYDIFRDHLSTINLYSDKLLEFMENKDIIIITKESLINLAKEIWDVKTDSLGFKMLKSENVSSRLLEMLLEGEVVCRE